MHLFEIFMECLDKNILKEYGAIILDKEHEILIDWYQPPKSCVEILKILNKVQNGLQILNKLNTKSSCDIDRIKFNYFDNQSHHCNVIMFFDYNTEQIYMYYSKFDCDTTIVYKQYHNTFIKSKKYKIILHNNRMITISKNYIKIIYFPNVFEHNIIIDMPYTIKIDVKDGEKIYISKKHQELYIYIPISQSLLFNFIKNINIFDKINEFQIRSEYDLLKYL